MAIGCHINARIAAPTGNNSALHYKRATLVEFGRFDRGKAAQGIRGANVVGAAGFEPATFWSQTRRATRLRYAPKYQYPMLREVR